MTCACSYPDIPSLPLPAELHRDVGKQHTQTSHGKLCYSKDRLRLYIYHNAHIVLRENLKMKCDHLLDGKSHMCKKSHQSSCRWTNRKNKLLQGKMGGGGEGNFKKFKKIKYQIRMLPIWINKKRKRFHANTRQGVAYIHITITTQSQSTTVYPLRTPRDSIQHHTQK